MSRKSTPSRYRFLMPFFYSLLPFGAGLFWLYVTGIVASFAHLPVQMLPVTIAFFVASSPAIGMLISVYCWWADFVRGDYYFEFEESLN